MRAFPIPNEWPSLIHGVKPIDGEGLGEMLLRAAEMNCYPSTDWILSLAGMSGTALSLLISKAASELLPLAEVLGLPDVRALKPLLHPLVAGRPGQITFYGTSLRVAHLDLVHRRVSPRALRQSLHLRAIWCLRVLPFDPATKEMLLDRCPVCGRRFSFKTIIGVNNCAYCKRVDEEEFPRAAVDLRDFPQALIDVEDIEAIEFLTGLIDPDPVVRSSFRWSLCDDLQGLSRGALFELAVAICCALAADSDRCVTSLWRPARNEDYGKLTPRLLARAGRALLGWPDEFHRIADEVRAKATERAGYFGIKKELGPLLAITLDRKVAKAARHLVGRTLRENMTLTAPALPTVRNSWYRHRPDLMTMQEAADELLCSRRHMLKLSQHPDFQVFRSSGKTGPTLFCRAQIKDVVRKRLRLLPSQHLAIDLGIPRAALCQLANDGLLKRETGPVTLIVVGKEYYVPELAQRLVEAISARVRRDAAPARFVRITKAINRLGLTSKHVWTIVLQAIIDGKIHVWRISGRLNGLMTSLAVAEMSDITRLFSETGTSEVPDDLPLTQSEAARILGTTPHNITALAGSGLLPKKITSRDLSLFSSNFVMTSDVLELLRERGVRMSSKSLAQRLKGTGIRPYASLMYGGKLVWELRDVSAFVEKMAGDDSESRPDFRDP